MEAQLKTAGGRVLIKVTAESIKDLFKQVATVQEVFDADTACGVCRSQDIKFRVRTVEENDYYEIACTCGARLQFGQHKKGGGLFPKRKDEGNKYLPNRGWSKFEGPVTMLAPEQREAAAQKTGTGRR